MRGHDLVDGFGQNPAPPQTNQALRRRRTQVICAGTGQTDQAAAVAFADIHASDDGRRNPHPPAMLN
jgi:hypothetical protein